MSKWTHPICDKCWNKRRPGKPPPRSYGKPKQRCCFCGALTHGGIFVRADPAKAERCAGH